MTLEIISPEATLFSGEVSSVILPGIEGSFQILDRHAPIVSILSEGVIKIVSDHFTVAKEVSRKFVKIDNHTHTLAIQSGTIEMNNNKIIVLAD